MRRALKIGLIASIVAIIGVGAVVSAFAKTENPLYEFCTTKAYGWPAPWRIDYCECEGSKTVFPSSGKVVNLSAIGGTGFIAFALAGGITLLRQRPH